MVCSLIWSKCGEASQQVARNTSQAYECEHSTPLLARRTPSNQRFEWSSHNHTDKKKKSTARVLFLFGRSVEIRTPGLQFPNQFWTVFAIISPHLDTFPLGKPYFRDLLRTLFPHSPLPYMVYTVVKPQINHKNFTPCTIFYPTTMLTYNPQICNPVFKNHTPLHFSFSQHSKIAPQ